MAVRVFSFHVTSRGSTNVEWMKVTCFSRPVLRRKVHTLLVAAGLHSRNPLSFDGVLVNVIMGFLHAVIDTATKYLAFRLFDQMLLFQNSWAAALRN